MIARNYASGTIWTRDCIEVMRGMNSETVDLIYLDPPFNSKQDYAAPIGSQAAGAAFKDTWSLSDIDVEWIDLIERRNPALQRVILAAMTDSDKSYLAYMAARLLEMPRLLKPTGSIYLHCDPTMSHYLKLVMDAIFGRANFRNEIIWNYYNKYSPGKKVFGRSYDQLFFYTKSDNYTFNPQRESRDKPTKQLIRENVGGVLKNKKNENGKVMYREVTDKKVDAVWRIPAIQPAASDYLGYPTQKHIRLLERVIKASSDPGEMVLDPFCGCATTCVAAENLSREWVGIDLSPKAGELVLERLGAGGQAVRRSDIILRDDIPARTDLGPLPRYNSREVKQQLYGQQVGCCAGCADHFEFRHFEVDHVIARSRGGTDHLSNLQLLCGHCNRVKGDRGMEYLSGKLQLGAAAG